MLIVKTKTKMKTSDLLNFKWCIENDLQVYIKPEHSFARICIRRGGITSEGKDYYYTNGIRVNTPEQRGTVLYKSQDLAAKELVNVYKYLREKHEKT
jgi:hypothetical protein